MICGLNTNYIHLDFEAHMHFECEKQAWEMYIEANRAIDERYGELHNQTF